MNVIEELRTFTDDAWKIVLAMSSAVTNAKPMTSEERAALSKFMDEKARELGGVADCIKDLAYKVKETTRG